MLLLSGRGSLFVVEVPVYPPPSEHIFGPLEQ